LYNARNFHRGQGNYQHTSQEYQGNNFYTTIANNTYTTSKNDVPKGQIE